MHYIHNADLTQMVSLGSISHFPGACCPLIEVRRCTLDSKTAPHWYPRRHQQSRLCCGPDGDAAERLLSKVPEGDEHESGWAAA